MKGLIINDIFSIRKVLKSVAFVFVLFMVMWGLMDQAASGALMIGIMSASYMLNLFSYDEFYHWEQYMAILPVTRAQVVLARYATYGLTSLVSTGISAIYMLVMRVAHEEFLMVLIALLCMQTYSAAVLIPTAYKFGVQKGRVLYVLLMFIPFGIFLGVLAMVFDNGGHTVPQLAIGIFAAMLALFVVGTAISIRISIHIVSRKQY